MPDLPEALIQMRHGSCPSERCPVYQVSIFMDGTFVYEGVANVAEVGRRTGRVSSEVLDNLLSTIEASGFLDRPQECCVCPTTDGSHLVVVEYHPGAVQKTVVHDERCASAPAAISALEGAIAQATTIRRWIAPSPKPLHPTAALAAAAEVGYSPAAGTGSQN